MAAALTVRDVMHAAPVVVPPDCPVREVLRLMNEHRIGAVMIVQEGAKLVGIFSERDLLKRIIPAIPGWRDYPVSDWMTIDPYTITPGIGWDDAVGLMTRLRVRHLPVIDAGRVIGLVSARGLMGRRSEHLDRIIAESTAEIRRVNEDLIGRDAELRQNLRAAGRLQRELLLPKTPPEWTELEWAVHYAPLDHLGGDYYDYAQADENHLGLMIADASGHSIAAAMVAIVTRIAFAEEAFKTAFPGKVLTALNSRLLNVADERFVTAFYCVLHRKTRVLRYSAAGHPDPLHIDGGSGAVTPLVSRNFLLGIMPDEVYSEREITIRPGDRIAFYTDGLIEARNGIGDQFGTDRLKECLARCGRNRPASVVREVLDAQTAFCDGSPMTDDVSLVVLGIGI
jgi:serine phosphatase RsbU (regulator of sigma subunit)/CBS domain-containing protein